MLLITKYLQKFQLLQENEEIGKMISSGRLAKLEGELAMQKNLCEEMKKNQAEMDDFVQASFSCIVLNLKLILTVLILRPKNFEMKSS